MIHFVILAGGRGERFWPLSSSEYPKPFLTLWNQKSFFRLTLDRLIQLKKKFQKGKVKIWIVTEKKYHPWVKQQAPGIPRDQIILEPAGRNTAAAIGLTAKKIIQKDPEAVMICFPSDHWIHPLNKLGSALQRAFQLVTSRRSLVLLGVTPRFPATGLGYIEIMDKPIIPHGYPVKQFYEKPPLRKAKAWIQDKHFFWNCGIFLWKAQVLMEELRRWLPHLAKKLTMKQYRAIKPISIDYGVLQRSRLVYCVPVSMDWDDLGSWENLWHFIPKNKNGNALLKGSWRKIDTQGCLVYSNGIPIATLGVSNLIVVQGPKGILICPRNRAQEVRKLANQRM